eukprot:TRINITY_DN1847_c0_g1_i1.p1 TRINITY_DN1847_c0_g1~~TRINITY_DN1847_c0_g1_i1.p1  ORF type:complete len:848 (-),score=140.93 TRINITY_DN1847_c0_g1_i1:21-2564(-)
MSLAPSYFDDLLSRQRQHSQSYSVNVDEEDTEISPLVRSRIFEPDELDESMDFTDPASPSTSVEEYSTTQDILPANIPHKFTKREYANMQRFEARDLYEPITESFQQHLLEKGEQPQRAHIRAKWLMMMLVGVTVGLVGFVVKETIDALTDLKGRWLQKAMSDRSDIYAEYKGWMVVLWCNLALATVASGLVSFIQPAATGSGVPEVMGELNGVHLPGVLRMRTLVVKIISVICCVASGLPVGAQGPLIHIGAMIGSGLSQGQSRAFHFQFRWKFFKRFRNTRDQYDFVSAGGAAGVAAAFTAPVGGVLFVMECIASWWDQVSLTGMIFFTCLITSWFGAFLSSALQGWVPTDQLGFLNYNVISIFEHDVSGLPLHIFYVIPATLLGVLCGYLGVAYTLCVLRVVRFRVKYIGTNRYLRVLEVMLLTVAFTSMMFWMPYIFACKSVPPEAGTDGDTTPIKMVNYICTNQTDYSPFATLANGKWTNTIGILMSPRTKGVFPYEVLLAFFAVYFVFSVLVAGATASSGFVIPLFVLGAVVGRLVGNLCQDGFDWLGMDKVKQRQLLDPGIFAFLGAGAFFSGATRLTVSLTVILVEMSGDVHHLFALMLSVQVAKWVGDHFTHSLYHRLLSMKCIPFLDPEMHLPSTMHTLTVSAIMAVPVVAVTPEQTVQEIRSLLAASSHNAFPVVKQHETMELIGMVSRAQLVGIVSNPEILEKIAASQSITWKKMASTIDRSYLQMAEDQVRLPRQAAQQDTVRISLHPWLDKSPWTVDVNFSLRHAYGLFRSMGLRHLLVVDGRRVVGIVSRKDLLCPPSLLRAAREVRSPRTPRGSESMLSEAFKLPSGRVQL